MKKEIKATTKEDWKVDRKAGEDYKVDKKVDEDYKKESEKKKEPKDIPAKQIPPIFGKKEEKTYSISFSEKEITNSRIKTIVENLVNEKLNLQRGKDYYEVTESEFELLKKYDGFVPKEKYGGEGRYPTEIGKYKGKRVVII